MALRKLSLNANDGRKALAFDDIGIGLTNLTVLNSFDWQQSDFVTGAIYLTNTSTWSNTPPAITFPASTQVYVQVDGITSSGTVIELTLVANQSNDATWRIYKVRVANAKGSRTFSIRQIFTNTDVVPVANGGTGSNSPITAAYNIGALPVRGAVAANADLNTYGPSATTMGIWFQDSSTNAQPANNFPEVNAVGLLEVFAGGQWGCTQRYTVRNGNVYVRSLTGAWNGTDGPWGEWSLCGVNTRPGIYSGDLNLLVTPGVWSVGDSNTGTTNAPSVFGQTTSNGICEVILRNAGNTVLQRFTTMTSSATTYNYTWQRTLYGTTWSPWELVGKKALNELGIGANTFTVMSSFDWQQMDFYTAANHLVIFSNMTNTPSGISYTAGTYVWVRVVGSNGQSISVELVASTSVDGNYKIYEVLIGGTKGARTFSVRQLFTSTDVVPVANGGTGATTPAGARTALQLGDSATKNVGATAGTVAAGDDSRIVNAAQKSGFGITGVIEFLNNSTSGAPGEGLIMRAAHGVSGPGDFTNNVWQAFTHDGSYSRMQHYTTSVHSIRMIIVGATGGTGVFTFGQTGTAVASNAWVNSGSDERIKDDIRPVENPRDILMNVRAATWKFKHKGAEGRFGIGVIANDIAKYFPNAVFNTGPRELDDGTIIDDVLAVEAGDSGSMVAVHHAVLQSLVEENNSQQKEIDSLKSELRDLRELVENFINK